MTDKIIEKFNKRHGNGAWGSGRYEYEKLEWQAACAAMQQKVDKVEHYSATLQATVRDLREKCQALRIEIQESKR